MRVFFIYIVENLYREKVVSLRPKRDEQIFDPRPSMKIEISKSSISPNICFVVLRAHTISYTISTVRMFLWRRLALALKFTVSLQFFLALQ